MPRSMLKIFRFPFKVTQRVPIIEIITCEGNCDNLTLVRPSFVPSPCNSPRPILLLHRYSFSDKIDNYCNRSVPFVRQREGGRDLEISSKWAAKGGFIPRVVRLVKRSRSRKGAAANRPIHEIRLNLGIGNRASRPQVGHCPPGEGLEQALLWYAPVSFTIDPLSTPFRFRPPPLSLSFAPPLVVFLFQLSMWPSRASKREVGVLENRATSPRIPRWIRKVRRD